jgi:hypothetical protein
MELSTDVFAGALVGSKVCFGERVALFFIRVQLEMTAYNYLCFAEIQKFGRVIP